jgi:hypothetical protein
MNPSIYETLKDWQFFFSTVAAATATLTGLLFVALSINIKRFRKPKNAERIRTARGAFGDFLYVLMIAIMFLVPLREPAGFVIGLFVLGLARLAGLIRQVVQTAFNKQLGHTAASLVREFALPFVAALGLIGIGIFILLGFYVSIFYLVMVIAALLTTASWKAWHLLMVERSIKKAKEKPIEN